MDWTKIIETVLTNAVFLTVMGFVAKSLFEQLLSKDVEKFKLGLQMTHDKELEKFRSDLKLAAFEYETRFAVLHKERADVIAELYRRLVRAENSFASAASPLDSGEEKGTMAVRAASEFWSFFSEHRIYLNDDLCVKLGRLAQEFKGVWADILTSQFSAPDAIDHRPNVEAWMRALDKTSKEIPHIRRDIEKEFRKMLGDTENQKSVGNSGKGLPNQSLEPTA